MPFLDLKRVKNSRAMQSEVVQKFYIEDKLVKYFLNMKTTKKAIIMLLSGY